MYHIKTSNLSGAALDWAVARCEGIDALVVPERRTNFARVEYRSEKTGWDFREYSPSTNWAHGGPIIEREKLCTGYRHQVQSTMVQSIDPVLLCWARDTVGGYLSYAPTILIAAMRCYVASKLGEEIEVPNGLL